MRDGEPILPGDGPAFHDLATGVEGGATVADVRFKDVDKIYDNGVQAVFDLSLRRRTTASSSSSSGPSGCGKTTALRMVAGLEEITGGDGLDRRARRQRRWRRSERDIAMVFQNYALYPHLTVVDNIAFGLRLRKMPKEVINERVEWAAKLLDLTPYLDRQPKELSGGQRQRVAMGRAIVRRAAGVPDGRAALEPRREAARPDARRHREAAARARRRRRSTSPTTRSRR